jgi:hypothetical protein
MKLKGILLTGMLFLSSLGFSQKPLHFEIYSKGEGFFSPRLNNSSLEVSPKEVSFSFLFGIYSMDFQMINDSTYRETVKDFWNSKEEVFDYSFKDSHYTLKNYSAVKGKIREEKEVLEGKVFDKKYKSLPESFDAFEKGLLKDSAHFVILGMPYSFKIDKRKKGQDFVYSCNMEKNIKSEPGDVFIFPFPVEVLGKKEKGKFVPYYFSTNFLRSRNGNKIHLEGILTED